jgi:SAM-dependent methyltransferase
MKLIDWLKLPEIKNITDLDDPAATALHGKILRKKTFLKKLYTDFYRRFKDAVTEPEHKILIELGSGGGFIKDIIPNVITSDILSVPGVDMVFSAMDMPFADNSIDAFLMFDVLHHISDPRKFFSQADRCLKPAGRIVMIEPANTPWARFIYKNFHHEGFEPAGDWHIEKTGPLSQANGAIPWIIFVRDRIIFQRDFPRFKIISLRNHTPFCYLISGGFTLRQLMPGFLYPAARAMEFLLSAADNWLGMFMTIILEKTNQDKTLTK